MEQHAGDLKQTGAVVNRVWKAGAVLVGVGALVVGLLAWMGRGPFSNEPRQLTFSPIEARTLGEGGDLQVIVIVFPWPEDGFCSGQFSVSAQESETSVVVGQVKGSEWRPGELCAGLGSDGRVAAVDLTLRAPLGQRVVFRAVDGATLPVKDHCEQQEVPAWCSRPQ